MCVGPCSSREDFQSPRQRDLSEEQVELLATIGKRPDQFKLHRLRRLEFTAGWKEHNYH